MSLPRSLKVKVSRRERRGRRERQFRFFPSHCVRARVLLRMSDSDPWLGNERRAKTGIGLRSLWDAGLKSLTSERTFSPRRTRRTRRKSRGNVLGQGFVSIVAGLGGGYLSIYRDMGTSGSTSFASLISYPTGSGDPVSIFVTVADINGDGRPDIAVGNFYTTNVVFFQNISQY